MKGDKLKKENSNSKIIKKIQKNFSHLKLNAKSIQQNKLRLARGNF